LSTPNPTPPPDAQPDPAAATPPVSPAPEQPVYQPGVAPATQGWQPAGAAEQPGWPAQPAPDATLQQPAYDPGQPVYQPGSAQPVYPSNQPTDQWAQPAYGQPGYEQPAYAQPGYPPYPSQPAPTKSRTGLWIALAVVAVLLLGGAATVAFFALGNGGDKKPAASTSNGAGASPTAATTTPSTEQSSSAPSTSGKLVTPDTIGNLKISDNPTLSGLADQMKSEAGSDGVGAVYQDKDDPSKIVLVAGVAEHNTSPSAALTGLLSGFIDTIGADAGAPVGVDAGPKGGVAKCGEASVSGQNVVYCAWADDETTALVAFFNHDVAEAKDQFLTIRDAVEPA
jgi:hypothetical protein